MYTHAEAVLLALLLAAPVIGQDTSGGLELGGDRFLAGRVVTLVDDGVDDLFMAGEIVRGEAEITGSVHLAGRAVEMAAAVGGDAYMAGMTVVLSGGVAGDATLAGYDVRVDEVGGDLRISGGTLVIGGPVAGYALISGDEVRIEGPILGDVHFRGNTLSFTEDARIDGRLILFEADRGEHVVPANVAPEDRIERRLLSEWEDAVADAEGRSWERAARESLVEVAVLALLAALAAALAPRKMRGLRSAVLGSPRQTLVRGFMLWSTIAGSTVLLALTVFGLLLVPASILLALVVGFAGYVVAVYALGVGLLLAFGRPEPEGLGARTLAAIVGALAARSVALVPYVGWLALLTLTLAGVGAFTLRWLQPAPAATS